MRGKLGCKCGTCDKLLPFDAKFCDDCGSPITPDSEEFETIQDAQQIIDSQPVKTSIGDISPIAGERKHVTVLFSDISGYTAMSERLDPEEVKDITSQIFDDISKIVSKYDGFVEKFAGDAVMALFGAEEAHEDDPIRAIKTAKEIHSLVNKISPKYEEFIERPLSMHTGINTGLVVTGDINLEKGTHGVAGDTLNVAARLSSMGNADEIMVGSDTFYQAEGFFNFESLSPVKVKGKANPIQIYKVLDFKEKPRKVHRLQGVRADLIGRIAEMRQLKSAVERLQQKQGTIISICGTAGTGKSRLIEEFKASLDLKEIQWHEGQAYPYAQNIPYSPLINMLSRALQIEEGDSVKKVKGKIEVGIANLLNGGEDVIPYIGSLYSLPYPEIEDVSPEFWQTKVFKAVQSVLAALGRRGPTVICLEDLHWADPSFLDLIRWLLVDLRFPILLLCVYRPIITVFTSQQINALAHPYEEIRLQDLSASESQVMVESLLETNTVPEELQRFIQGKIEGNPFYLEEMINSMIDSRALIRDNGNWRLGKAITEADISSTVHGVISSRLDRLENETKRILQEASVIGRTFYYEILTQVTVLNKNIDTCLSFLERLDLIKTRVIHPDLEYFFKHALTQEVVYSGLLKKERREIHERIGRVIEQVFQERLPEFYEVLAYHFSHGESTLKAVDYIIKAGEKSLRRYSLDEAHQYFSEAFELISKISKKTNETEDILVDMLIKWSYVFYYRGDFKTLDSLLKSHQTVAESIDDKEKKGMFFAWMGMTVWVRNQIEKAYEYLIKALSIGKDSEKLKVVAYASTWLSWVCGDMGLFNEGIAYGEEGNRIAKSIKSDHYLYFKSLAGIGFNHGFKGNAQECLDVGHSLIKYGNKYSNIRCLGQGYSAQGYANYIIGDVDSGIESYIKAIEVSIDPTYKMYFNFFLMFGYIYKNNLKEARNIYDKMEAFSTENGCEVFLAYTKGALGLILIGEGQMSKGMQVLEDTLQECIDKERKYFSARMELAIGKVYLEIAKGEKQVSIKLIAKNLGFIFKHALSAPKKAEYHLKMAVNTTDKLGAESLKAGALRDLGTLYRIKKQYDQSREHLERAIKIYEKIGASVFLEQAKEELTSLN